MNRDETKCVNCQALQNKIHDNLVGFVEAISSMMEFRDPYTSGHQIRVKQLSEAISEKLGFTDQRVKCVGLIAGLHDIGKIKTPSDILTSPKVLNSPEIEIIRQHCQTGYDILKNVNFTCNADNKCAVDKGKNCILAQAIKEHHECPDGSGYPDGKTDITEEALIIRVADTVEAMVSHRPYRPSRGLDKALLEIINNKGTRYWGNAVEACLDVFHDGFTFIKHGRLMDDIRA